MKNSKLWGIDLGGTKIEGVVLNNSTLEVISRTRIATEAQHGYEHILQRIKLLIDQISDEIKDKPTKVGIGTPGSIDPQSSVLKNSNSTSLNGKPFKTDLEKVLEVPIEMANDANCCALAEYKMGIIPDECPDAKVVFGVIMGTGVGGGIVVDGRLINGLHSIAGEWGHNFLDEEGGECYCGKIGCVERNISGPALQRYYKSISGKELSLKEIHSNYKSGNDPYAKETMERLVDLFGKGISVVVNILDPDAIVLGGGVGNIDLLYSEGKKALDKYIFNVGGSHTKILKPKLGDSAGVFGAALLVK
ncbi:MAG: ROK family protein [Bacteroidota bacterium]